MIVQIEVPASLIAQLGHQGIVSECHRCLLPSRPARIRECQRGRSGAYDVANAQQEAESLGAGPRNRGSRSRGQHGEGRQLVAGAHRLLEGT